MQVAAHASAPRRPSHWHAAARVQAHTGTQLQRAHAVTELVRDLKQGVAKEKKRRLKQAAGLLLFSGSQSPLLCNRVILSQEACASGWDDVPAYASLTNVLQLQSLKD